MNKYLSRIITTVVMLLMIPVGVYGVQIAVNYFSSAGGTTADLVIDLNKVNPRGSDAWRNLAQGGEERGRMIQPVIGPVKNLAPQYIRIDHVFDYYTQAELDGVISDITAAGAKPFISLSYMPSNLAKGGDVSNEPNNWTDWENLVENTIEHISGKGGLGISNVYYEVWNEPDLFGKFKMGGEKNYLDLYSHAAIGASRASDTLPFKFGGPATTGYYDSWMRGLLNMAANGVRLDFISWHRYSYQLDDFTSDADKATALLAEYGRPDMETAITEMGPNSENDKIYDNGGIAHEIAVLAALQDKVDKVFTFEIKDGPGTEKYWGRWGLFTHEKFGAPEAKPRVAALNYLNRMIGGEHLSVTGQGSWVVAFAKRLQGNLVRLLLVNYDPKGKHEEFVPIKFTNLPSGNFSVKRTEFSGGSFTQDIATSSAEWVTNQYLKPNSAMIIEIIQK